MKVLIDMGHGGIDSKGIYTTAPNKMYKFKDGTIAYEGVINRDLGVRLGNELNKLKIKNSFVTPPFESDDVFLKDRVRIVNNVKERHILVSLHCNAGGGTGYEQYTTRGKTNSDKLSNAIAKTVKTSAYKLRKRWFTNHIDEYDKESNFYILKHSNCECVLIECFFFDSKKDYDYMNISKNRDILMSAIARGIQKYLKTLE